MMTLKEMRDIDINTVNKDSIVDAGAVLVDMDLPKLQRMAEVVNQMNGNPYFLVSEGILVKVSFIDTDVSLDERMESHLRTV
jgi:hypothetical protein